jgi:pyroglutamyl-peptidase
MRTILLTGFEPFGKFRVNSSWESIRDLDGACVEGWTIRCRRLPVSFRRAGPALERAILDVRPGRIVSFGVAPDRAIRLERVAVNIDHSDRRDNDGRRAQDRRIDPRAPLALESRLPLAAILRRLRRGKFRAKLSFHAGTYLCNHVFFRLARLGRIAGFVHLPPVARGKIPGWTLSRLRRAVGEIVAQVACAS